MDLDRWERLQSAFDRVKDRPEFIPNERALWLELRQAVEMVLQQSLPQQQADDTVASRSGLALRIAMVDASGGEIRVWPRDLENVLEKEIIAIKEADGSVILRTRQRKRTLADTPRGQDGEGQP